MSYLTKENIQQARVDFGIDTKITEAIKKADAMSQNGGSNMTVVRSKDFSLCVYNDFKMKVAQNDIIEVIYSTNDGFIYHTAA